MLSVQNKVVYEEVFHNNRSKYSYFVQQITFTYNKINRGGKKLGILINRRQQFNSEVPKASALLALQTLTGRKQLGAGNLGVHKLSLQRFQIDGKTL